MLAIYLRERNSSLRTTMERLCANNAFLEKQKYTFLLSPIGQTYHGGQFSVFNSKAEMPECEEVRLGYDCVLAV